EIYASFRWSIPDTFNIGYAVCDSWAELQSDRPAIYDYRTEGQPDILSFGELRSRSDALAAALKAKGIERGDRVAILLPQCFESAIAHVAIYKLGAIAVPLAMLFGVEALEYRLHTAGVRAIITNGSGLEKITQIRSRLPNLDLIVST